MMLQASKTSALVGAQSATAEWASSTEIFAFFSNFVRRQWRTLAFVTLLMTALGSVYVVTASPSFTAQATIIIDTRKAQLFQQQLISQDASINSAIVASEVEILNSENIALPVIKQLHLTEDPEFVGPTGDLFLH